MNKEIKEKIELWKINNDSLVKSIINRDNVGFASLISKDVSFKDIHQYLTHEEIDLITQEEYENISENDSDRISEDFSSAFSDYFLNYSQNDPFLDFMAEKMIGVSGNYKQFFDQSFFSFTNNVKLAKKYMLESSTEENKSVFFSFLHGIVYNNSNYMYDELIRFIPRESFEGLGPYPLTNKEIYNNKYYNFNTYKKIFDKKIEIYRENKDVYAVNSYYSVMYDLIYYPLRTPTPNDEIKNKVIDLILEDYKKETLINNDVLATLDIFYKKHTLYQDKMSLTKSGSNKKNRTWSSLSKTIYASKLEKSEEDIKILMSESIKEVGHALALDFFHKIGIPHEKYKELEMFVELQDNLSSNIKYCGKANKI